MTPERLELTFIILGLLWLAYLACAFFLPPRNEDYTSDEVYGPDNDKIY